MNQASAVTNHITLSDTSLNLYMIKKSLIMMWQSDVVLTR